MIVINSGLLFWATLYNDTAMSRVHSNRTGYNVECMQLFSNNVMLDNLHVCFSLRMTGWFHVILRVRHHWDIHTTRQLVTMMWSYKYMHWTRLQNS